MQSSFVHLSGPNIEEFAQHYGAESVSVATPIRDSKVRKTVFDAAKILVRRTNRELLVVQTAHASQCSWTYEKYNIAELIKRVRFG